MESDWNENLHPHSYQTKVQSQVSARQPPPSWASWRKEESLPTSTTGKITPNENKNDKSHETEVYYELPEDIPDDIIINHCKTISQEEFNKM